MDAARPGGRVLLFAQTQRGEAIIDPAAICVEEKTLLGSYSASVDIQEEALRLVFEGYGEGYDLTRLVSHRFPLSEAVEAISVASKPTATSMKIVIEAP
jgi:L-iditol 2-dehydrogenase